MKHIEFHEGYEAFNGYILTASDAKVLNTAYCVNEDERHRLFCIVIGLYGKREA